MALEPDGMLVKSITRFRICLKKTLVAPKPKTPPFWYWSPSMTPKPEKLGVAFSVGRQLGLPMIMVL